MVSRSRLYHAASKYISLLTFFRFKNFNMQNEASSSLSRNRTRQYISFRDAGICIGAWLSLFYPTKMFYCSSDWQAHLVSVKHFRSDDGEQPKAADAAGVASGNAVAGHKCRHRWRHVAVSAVMLLLSSGEILIGLIHFFQPTGV